MGYMANALPQFCEWKEWALLHNMRVASIGVSCFEVGEN
jgi:hypothetical protein